MRNVVLSISTVLDQQLQVVIVDLTRMQRIQFGQLLEDHTPGARLLFGVLDSWYLVRAGGVGMERRGAIGKRLVKSLNIKWSDCFTIIVNEHAF